MKKILTVAKKKKVKNLRFEIATYPEITCSDFQFVLAAIFCQITWRNCHNIKIRLKMVTPHLYKGCRQIK